MKTILIFLLLGLNLYALSIGDLLKAVKEIPDSEIDRLFVKETSINKKEILGALYPKLSFQASAAHFNIPSSVRPLPPTKSMEMITRDDPIPFSQTIYKVGFELSMPIFVKEIYDNKNRMKFLLNTAKYRSKIELLKREALLVTYLSNLNYFFALKKALLKRQSSIKKSYLALKKGVDVGRVPEFKLLRLKDALNSIKIKVSEIETFMEDIKSKLYKLTKIRIDKPIKFRSSDIQNGEFISIKLLKENLKASRYKLKAKKDLFYPSVLLKAKANRSFASAYNNDENLALNYAEAGVYIVWNIFDKSLNANIQKAKVEMVKKRLQIEKEMKDLTARIVKIENSLKEIDKRVVLNRESLSLKKELLKGAKVAFRLNRMSVDDYLRYEDDLANLEASLANLKALRDTFLAQKALIYGKNFERIFR